MRDCGFVSFFVRQIFDWCLELLIFYVFIYFQIIIYV